jgi:Flp pilus assembly protein CpaB
MRSARDLLVTLGGWPRRLAALACVLLAAVSALGAGHASRSDSSGVPVVVARHALAAGSVATADDLRIARWPGDRVPDGASDAATDVAGRRLAGAVERGEAVLASDLLGPGLTDGLHGDQVALPVTLTDPLATNMIHAGDRVDVLAKRVAEVPGGTATSVVVARHALVLAVYSQHHDAIEGSNTELVIAASRTAAGRVATLDGAAMLAVVDRPG